MIRDILFWIAQGGILMLLIVLILCIRYMQIVQGLILGQVNKELEYLIELRYELLRFINIYNSRHGNKIISEDVEPINMDEI